MGKFREWCLSYFLVIFLATAFLAVVPSTVHADSHTKGFVTLSNGHALYIDYVPAAANKPTVVLLNGLTYSTESWNAYATALEAYGLGVLRYDPMGMGQTLLKYAPVTNLISLDDQAYDLKLLLDMMNIRSGINLIGLSYGGGLAIRFTAAYPTTIGNCIMMAPFVAPLAGQDNLIRNWIAQTRIMYPMNPLSDDDLYDYYLHQLIISTYPQAEPSSLDNPYKLEAIYNLVRGARKFHAANYVEGFPAGRMHLIIARNDQYIENSVHNEFWNQIPAAARASRIYIEGSEHKIPEVFPKFAAAWAYLIVTGNAQVFTGATFVGAPTKGSATSPGIHIAMPKEQ